MTTRSALARLSAPLVLAAALAVGAPSFIPSTFACGTNAGAGNCKSSGPTEPDPSGWLASRWWIDAIVVALWP
jgi:hypothetical protein